MRKLFSSASSTVKTSTFAPAATSRPPVQLVQRFIETGDERCPLAGLWTQVTLGEPADDPERTWPAVRPLLSWRAFTWA